MTVPYDATLRDRIRDNLAAHLTDAMESPEPFWDAVLKTRQHLARHHSIAQRLEELEHLMCGGAAKARRFGRAGASS